MAFKSYRKETQNKLNQARNQVLNTIAVAGDSWITAEIPVDTGQLRSSQTFETNEDEKSVTWGNSATHSLWVHEGSSRNPVKQPFIRRPIESRGNDLKDLAEKVYKALK